MIGAPLLMLFAASLAAHPIHTTYAEVVTDATTVTVTIRAFADDLSAAVARFNGRAASADSSAPAADVQRYADALLQVRDASGRAVALAPCGVKRAGIVTFVCVRFPRQPGLTATNRLLTDRHADQVNIMRATGGRTVLFTATTPAQSLLPGSI